MHTDASSGGFGAVLLQQAEDGQLYLFQYMSKKTSPQQEMYCSYELKFFAVIEALKKIRSYLVAHKFKIVTHCSVFRKTLDKENLPPKLSNWALFIEGFECAIEHRPATRRKYTDALSRNID